MHRFTLHGHGIVEMSAGIEAKLVNNSAGRFDTQQNTDLELASHCHHSYHHSLSKRDICPAPTAELAQGRPWKDLPEYFTETG